MLSLTPHTLYAYNGNSKPFTGVAMMGTVAFALMTLMIILDIWVLGCVLELVTKGNLSRMVPTLQT